MATLIFAQAKAIRKKVLATVKLHADCGSDKPVDVIANSVIEGSRHEFREILKIARLLHEDYEETIKLSATNWYFITIRPKPGISFLDLYYLVHKYVNRAFMIEYTLTFEQKDPEGSGQGFHCHIVANTKHRSKGEVLRDTVSTFKTIAADNCIDVKTTKNPKDIINNYMIAYKSDDDHKITTKQGDAIWRERMELQDIYENDIPFVESSREWAKCITQVPKELSSSPVTAPIIVELN